MRALIVVGLALSALLTISPVSASDPPVPNATVRVPECLQYPDSNTYKPCTGVVPADLTTGNALDWKTLIKGSPTDPVYTQPTINGNPVTNSNPLPITDPTSVGTVGSAAPTTTRVVGGKDQNGNTQILSTDQNGVLNVNCIGCGSNSAGGGSSTSSSGTSPAQIRRAYWSEPITPLAANAKYYGQVRDNGGSIQGSPTIWNGFGCFVQSDQAGTLYLQASNDGSNWFNAQSRAIPVNGTSIFLGQAIFTRYWRCSVFNGTTAQSYVILNSTFGM